MRDVSCVRRRARQINRARESGEENRHSVGKEILLKFLLLFFSAIFIYLVKPSMRRSDNYVSLNKIFFISARAVPPCSRLGNSSVLVHVSKLSIVFREVPCFLTILENRVLSRILVQTLFLMENVCDDL